MRCAALPVFASLLGMALAAQETKPQTEVPAQAQPGSRPASESLPSEESEPPSQDREEDTIFKRCLSDWIDLETLDPGAKEDATQEAWRALRRAARAIPRDELTRRLRTLMSETLFGRSEVVGQDGLTLRGWRPGGRWVPTKDVQGGPYRLIVRLVLDAQDDDPGSPWELPDPDPTNPVRGVDPLDQHMVVTVRMPEKLGLDDPIWNQGDVARARETARVEAFWSGLHAALEGMPRHDVNRIVLDCERGTCAFALRLASYSPDRFAAVLLREPQLVEGLRFESLQNLAIGLVADSLTRVAERALNERLNELRDGGCVTFEGFQGRLQEAGEIERYRTWMAQAQRSGARPHVVLAPNRQEDKAAFWIEVKAPRPGATQHVVASAARRGGAEANRVKIQASGVAELRIFLDERLVDLDAPIEIDINGVILVERVAPDLTCALRELLRRRDPGLVFLTWIDLAVPGPL